ncbi:MAG: hypothetical protein JWN79_1053 [Gemmatimonadetes bacterium]|nr:hypothetical protein [Gemmatimonadota bacterium]
MAIDRTIRWLVARTIGATLPRPASGAIARVRRVLFLRHDAIGDMLSSLGVIRAFAEHGLEVDVMASPENAAVLKDNPWGVGVHVCGRRGRLSRGLARTLAARRYDAVVDGLVLKPGVNSRTMRLLRASRAPLRVGSAGRRHDFLYTHPVVTDLAANHVEVLAALLAPFGIPTERALDPVPMPLSDAEQASAAAWWTAGGTGARLFVNLSASSPERRWSDARFVEALREIAALHPATIVAITGSPADWPSAHAIAEATGGRAFTGSLRDALALLAAGDLALTPDTSVAHASAGFGVRSVVLTPEGNLRFAPWRARARLVVAKGRGVESVSVREVVAALHEGLAELAPR